MNFYTNTNLCNSELCSVAGYDNTCQSGCCAGAYCQPKSACTKQVLFPLMIGLLLTGWVAIMIVSAYKKGALKRDKLLKLKEGNSEELEFEQE